MRYALAFLVLWLTACPSQGPVVAPPPVVLPADASPEDCQPMCTTLARLGCPEGTMTAGDGCVGTCRHIVEARFNSLNPKCVAAAASVEAVRACSAAVKCRGKS